MKSSFLFAITFVISGSVCQAQFCGLCLRQQTLTESLTGADYAVLAKWKFGVSRETEEDKRAGATAFEIVDILKQPADEIRMMSTVIPKRFFEGKSGELFLMLGSREDDSVKWFSASKATASASNYIKHLPPSDEKPAVRLAYFLRFVEDQDPIVSDDAYLEFSEASFADIVSLGAVLPNEKLRRWVQSSAIKRNRVGLYAQMLGVCGSSEDATFLEQVIVEPAFDFRLELEGMMTGYLMLSGEKGLSVLDESKLKNQSAPFSEVYAAMNSIRFMWSHGGDRISRDRLRQSMRILLDRPELADLAIADLARMKDWSVQDRLIQLYGLGEYDIPSIKRSIVRYMLKAAADTNASEVVEDSKSLPVENAKKYLIQLEERDPQTVHQATRLLRINLDVP